MLGCAAAGLLLAAGAINTNRVKDRADRVHAAIVACGGGIPMDALNTSGLAESIMKAHADCRKQAGSAPDPASTSRSERWPMRAAAIIAILGALPCAWYSLLRRVAELRAAIGGNPPAGQPPDARCKEPSGENQDRGGRTRRLVPAEGLCVACAIRDTAHRRAARQAGATDSKQKVRKIRCTIQPKRG